ncbi:MAG: cyclopropane-fatty-acyl-phospholipid synthase [Planctomycetaceae bacterium]|jgi:cyclopropane-fatty-acyl-phospholipid synthase
MSLIDLVEQGRVPDALTRFGIRRLLKQRLKKEKKRYQAPNTLSQFIDQMISSPLAINTFDANAQHYEVPTQFYDQVLGDHKKYSCCYFEPNVHNLSSAEEAMLALSCERAGVEDGMEILELGCGWGSLTLWLGQHYPNARITAVSNSSTQKSYIDQTAADRNITNLNVITCDMNDFVADQQYDRVVSIEMFEHMRNYKILFERISTWLKPTGKLWFHIFVHHSLPYFFQDEGEADWMARHFFTGGLMPSWDLPLQIPSPLKLENRWPVKGTHYAKTSRAWLNLIDANEQSVRNVFTSSDDPTSATVLFNRWRMFFMACEELFAYNDGREWYVGHYLFSNKET